MAAGNTVEGKAGPAAVGAADLDAGSIGSVRDDLHRQLVGEGGQLFHIALQFFGDGARIQMELQHQRACHPGEHRVQLGQCSIVKKTAAAGDGALGRCFGLGLFRGGHVGDQAGFAVHGGGVFFQFRGSKGTVTHGGDHLPQCFDAHIARSVQAIHVGFHGAVGDDVALLVQLCQSLDQRRGGGIARKDEHADVIAILGPVLGDLSGAVIAVADGPQGGISQDLLHFGIGQDRDLRVVFSRVGNGGGAGKIILADEDGHMACVLG